MLVMRTKEQSFAPRIHVSSDHAEEEALEASKRWAVRRLEQLGFQVILQSDEVA